MRNDGGPAFPIAAVLPSVSHANGATTQIFYQAAKDGMSLRDYFAAAALTGLLSSPNVEPKDGTKRPLHIELTFTAYECADAMLIEREAKS